MIELVDVFTIVAIILAGFSLILLYRVFRGPHIADRLVAADSIDILLGIISILIGCIEGNSMYIDLGLIVILLGFVGTVFICKYLEKEV